MSKELSEKELHEKILKCNRCGMCQSVCPIFRITGHEMDVARSLIRYTRMLVEGEYDWGEDQEITDHFQNCLLCKACVDACPSGVLTDQIMIQARSEINHVNGLPFFDKMVYRGIFSDNKRLDFIRHLLRLYQCSGLNWILAKGRGTSLKNVKKMGKFVPTMPKQSLREQLPSILRPVPNALHVVAYYPGCAINTFYPEIGKASIEVLTTNRNQVEVPPTVCCGAPHLSDGDYEEALKLAKQNIDFFEAFNVEAIITDCATCGNSLKGYAELLSNDTQYKDKALSFSSKVRDINEYLIQTGFSRNFGNVQATVTYHDPCHLNRGQRGSEPPREIIRSIPGVVFHEMQDADMCCGGAGSYSLRHSDLSEHILERKMANVKQTQATILATSCPSCIMQLSYGVKKYKIDAKVVHPVQLMAEAYYHSG